MYEMHAPDTGLVSELGKTIYKSKIRRQKNILNAQRKDFDFQNSKDLNICFSIKIMRTW